MKKRFLRFLSLVMVIVTMMSFFAVDTAAAKTNDELGTPEVSISLLTTPAIKLSWSEVDGADMYYVYRRDTSKGSLKLYAKTEKLYYKDTDVKEYGKYYYKVKAVTLNQSGKVTKRSAYSSMVTKTVINLKAPKITAKTVSDSEINLSWNAVDGADRYYIYMSTSKNGTYKSLGYVTKKSYTVSKLESFTTYYFKIKSAKVINGKVYKSDYSSVKSTRTEGKNGEFIVDFEKITNEEVGYPTGTPLVCLAMMMRNYGIDVMPKDLFEHVFIREPYKGENGKWYVDAYINGVYIGNPTHKEFVLGSPCIYGTLISTFEDYCEANKINNVVGNPFLGYYDNFEGVKQYINKGHVIACAIEENHKPITVEVMYKDATSKISGYSSETYFSSSTKYMLLCGYTSTEYIFYDPSDDTFKKYKADNDLFAGFVAIWYKDDFFKERMKLFGY